MWHGPNQKDRQQNNRKTHEKRATSYLLQRIGLAIQRGNVASILGTLPPSKNLNQIYYF